MLQDLLEGKDVRDVLLQNLPSSPLVDRVNSKEILVEMERAGWKYEVGAKRLLVADTTRKFIRGYPKENTITINRLFPNVLNIKIPVLNQKYLSAISDIISKHKDKKFKFIKGITIQSPEMEYAVQVPVQQVPGITVEKLKSYLESK